MADLALPEIKADPVAASRERPAQVGNVVAPEKARPVKEVRVGSVPSVHSSKLWT